MSQIDPVALLVAAVSILIVVIATTDASRSANNSDVTRLGHASAAGPLTGPAPLGWARAARLGVNASIIVLVLFAGAVGVHHFRWENWAAGGAVGLASSGFGEVS